MSSLDDKLRGILAGYAGYPKYNNRQAQELISQSVEQIKQAFTDEGWYHSPLVKYQMGRIKSGELMTGAEWYAKFEKELYKPKKQEYTIGTFTNEVTKTKFYRDGGTNFMYDQAIKAAKRAAGLAND